MRVEELPWEVVITEEDLAALDTKVVKLDTNVAELAEAASNIEVIRSEWNEVCDQAQLPSAEREQLWERQFLNPFSISTRGFGATAGA